MNFRTTNVKHKKLKVSVKGKIGKLQYYVLNNLQTNIHLVYRKRNKLLIYFSDFNCSDFDYILEMIKQEKKTLLLNADQRITF